jgi:Calx-beta domain/Domain of unknown function (DUF4114)
MAVTVSIKESKTILEGNIGSQFLTFDIVLSEAITTPVLVPYKIGAATDTATIDEDYAITIEPVTFNVGDPLTKSITFEIKGDRIVEADEVFTITLGTPIGATLGLNTVATGTILNDDFLPTVTIVPTANASEANTPGTFTLTRTGNLDLPLTVSITTAGSATPNNDYQPLPSLVTIAAGQTQAIITVNPIDDDLYEGTETITANLVANSTYTLGSSSSATISLLDNETLPVITVTPASQSILEKNTGDPANSATFQVQLSGKSATDITVNYTTVNGTATAGSDYAFTSGQLTFLAGSTTPKTILVPISPDNQFEPDETFTLQLSNPIGASIGSSVATATILNDDILPVVTLTAGPNAKEPITSGSFILNRTGDLTTALTVNLAATSGTATSGVDYQAIGTTATFAAGSSSATINLNPIDDDLYEGAENVKLALATGSTYTIGAAASAEISILDNETQPILTITPATQSIVEKNIGDPANFATFQIQLSGKSATDITVNYTTLNGTATGGSDYTATSGQLTFLAGSNATQTITVPITPDNNVEPDETFTIQLSNAIGATIGSTATATILNDDVLPVVTIVAGANVQEPSTNGTFILNRTGDLTSALTVNLGATTGTATSGVNYQAISTTATFAAGSSSSIINLTAIDDDLYEGTEKIGLSLQAGSNYTLGATTTAEISLIDNETQPILTITPATQNILEKNAGDPANSATFQVQLSGKSATNITVNYTTTNGTATAGSDYTATSGQLTFLAGSTTAQTITVPITPDNNVEPDETFTVQLSNPVGASIGSSLATATILNDDSLPVVTITAGINATEPSTNGTFILTRTGDLTTALTVTLGATSGTATSGVDYQAIGTTATFAAGSNNATINLNTIDDDIYEGTENVKLALTAGTTYTIGAAASAEISILDNETQPILTITPATQSIAEKNIGDPANSATFQVQLSGKSATNITVNYATINGTATSDSDFTATSGQLTFLAGSNTPQTITVPITPDNIVEPDESFTLQLSNPVGASIGSPVATAIILNDDATVVPNTPVISITAGVNAKEPSTSGTFILSRTGDLSSALTVNLITTSTSATSNIDFQPIANSITFAAGSNSATVEVKPIDDDIYEGTEKVGLLIQSGSNYSIDAAASAEILIEDNETQPILTVTPATQSIVEKNIGDPANSATFQVQLSGKSATPITVNYTTVNGTATSGSDFTTTSGQLTFLAGSNAAQTITVPITPDNTVEPDETFTLQLSNPVGASIGSPATVTILNDDILPVVTITAGTNAKEPSTNGTFILNRTGDLTTALTVNLGATSGTATSGLDFQSLATTAIFTAGSNSATVEVKPIDDDLYEGTEKVGLSIATGSTYTIGSSSTAEISIEDNETLPILTITPSTQSVTEKNVGDTANSASFQVQLSGRSATAITVDYTTINSTATAGSDFTATSGKLTFAPGSITSQTILVPITPDNTVEPDETFTLQLSNPTGATLNPVNGATAIIKNDDNLPSVSITPIDSQNLPVEKLPNKQTITFNRDGDLTQPLTIKYKLSRLIGTTTQETTNTVTFATGQNTTLIPLTIDSTAVYREIEKDTVSLVTDPSYTINNSTQSTTFSLGNNQTVPTVSISDAEIIEGDSGTLNMSFIVRLSTPSAQATSVFYQTADGTATASKDYTASSGTLVFAPKEVEKTINVPIIGDKIVEKNEDFTIVLSSPTAGATINKASAVGLIKNNDIAIASVIVTDAQAGEPNNPGQYSINLDSAADIPITVRYVLTGTATAGLDYISLPGFVTFAPGQTSQLLDIKVIDDNILEGSETVQLQLQQSLDYQVAAGKDTGIVTIADDEIAPPQLTTLPSSVFKVENAASTGTTLKFRKIEHQAFYRNEVSLFTVDDDNSTINGTAPSQTGYQNAAIQRSQVIFASLSDSPVDLQLDGQIDRYINLAANTRLGLLMVVGSSIDEINQGVKADVLFSFPSANTGITSARITNKGSIQQLAWEDTKISGDSDFNDLGLEISIEQAPNAIGTEQQGTKDIVDLRSFTGKKTFDISITGDAYYTNTVGFYKIDDLDGKVDGFKYGDSGYLAAALKRIVTSGVKGTNLSVQLDGGSILAPFLIANNSVANLLAGATSPVYFGNAIGNADKVDHIRLLGDNKFAFEDLFGGGDRDFNDVVLQISARP